MVLIIEIQKNIKKPTHDISFQLLFGRSKNKDLTDNFIKSVLNYTNDNRKLKNIKIQSEVSLEKLRFEDKPVRLDILAEYDEALVCIEMQNTDYSNIYERTRCYATKIGALQLERGQNYLELKPLIMIVILNYEPTKKYTSDYLENLIIVNEKYRDHNIKMGINFIFIYLPRFNTTDFLRPNKEFAQWLEFFKYKNMEVIDFMAIGNANIKKAKDEMELISAEEEEKRMARFYENGLLEQRFQYTAGVDAGRIEGKVEGKLEAFLELAKQMLKKKYDISEIKNLTGLSENEILNLSKSA